MYDYEARNFDPTLGRFIQIDMAAGVMRQYSPYSYAFDSPLMFVDKDGNMPTLSGGTDPAKEFIKGPKVDMKGAPKGSRKTAKGFARNSSWFWKQQLKKNPEMFSKRNAGLIKRGRSPEVDGKWVEFNPSHKAYIKDKLIHHHVDQGRFAVGIPDQAHKTHFKKLHSRYGAKAKGFFTKSMKFLGSFAATVDFLNFFSDNPTGYGQIFEAGNNSYKVGQIYEIQSSDSRGAPTYQELISTSIEYNDAGKETSRTGTFEVYEDYWYNQDTGKYEGKGYIGSYTSKTTSDGQTTVTKSTIPGVGSTGVGSTNKI